MPLPRRPAPWIILLLACLLTAGRAGADAGQKDAAPGPLPPDRAFTVESTPAPDGLALLFHVAAGSYLYLDGFSFEPLTPGLSVMPHFQRTASARPDPFRGTAQVFTHDIEIHLVASGSGNVRVGWQGASEQGITYPAQSRLFIINDGRPASAEPAFKPLTPINVAGSSVPPAASAAATPPATPDGMRPVRTVTEIDQALQAAAAQHRLVMLDLSAASCDTCRNMEKLIFTEPRVASRLRHMTVLRADVGANSGDDQAILGYFGVLNLPTLIFFRDGQELPTLTVDEPMTSDDFLKRLDQVDPKDTGKK